MLRPMVPAAEFEKYGFKQCKGKRYENCYYLCVARGCVMLFVSDVCFAVIRMSCGGIRVVMAMKSIAHVAEKRCFSVMPAYMQRITKVINVTGAKEKNVGGREMIKSNGKTLVIRANGDLKKDMADNLIAFGIIITAMQDAFPKDFKQDVKTLFDSVLNAENPIKKAEELSQCFDE